MTETRLTAWQRTEASVGADLVVAAQSAIPALDHYDPERMTPDELAGLVDRGVLIARALEKLEAEQRDILSPFQAGLSKIRDKFRPIINELRRAKTRAGELYTEGKASISARAKRAVEQAQAQANAAAAAAALEEGPPAPPAVVDATPPANVTRGAIGNAHGRRGVMQVKLVDVKLVAEQFPDLLTLNTAEARRMIQKALADGVDTFAGLEYWWPDSATFKAKPEPSEGAR